VRIAVNAKSAYDCLTRNLQRAKLHRAPTSMFLRAVRQRQLDVLAGLKPRLVTVRGEASRFARAGRAFSAVQQSIGTPQGRAAGAKYLREFAEDAKASGFVARAIERHAGCAGFRAAPAP